jgi:hypothetical protein
MNENTSAGISTLPEATKKRMKEDYKPPPTPFRRGESAAAVKSDLTPPKPKKPKPVRYEEERPVSKPVEKAAVKKQKKAKVSKFYPQLSKEDFGDDFVTVREEFRRRFGADGQTSGTLGMAVRIAAETIRERDEDQEAA